MLSYEAGANPAAITQYSSLKKLHYNSAIALYCNSNLVSITQFIMIVLIEKHCLHFENLNVHLVNHRILTNFVSTQWP